MDFETDIKPKLTALARHGLTALAGVMGTEGLLSSSTKGAFIDAGVAVVAFGGAVAWSFIQKELQKQSVQAALATPVAGTFSLDQAATMLAPLITQAINDALPLIPPGVEAAPSATVLTAVADTPSVVQLSDVQDGLPVQPAFKPAFKPPFGPQS
jgi:hypothetical protein